MSGRLALLVAAVLLALVTACDCGESKPGTPETDVGPDTAEDVVTEAPVDLPPDVDTDRIDDVEADASDVLEDDGGITRSGSPFQSETAGGAVLSSENYSMEVFIAPARPVGSLTSENYGMKVGPAGMRAP